MVLFVQEAMAPSQFAALKVAKAMVAHVVNFAQAGVLAAVSQ